jgi:hypothetical protein
VLLKAEAIVPTRELPAYGSANAAECHIAYHSSLMAAGWLAWPNRYRCAACGDREHAAIAASGHVAQLRALPRRYRLERAACRSGRGQRQRLARVALLQRCRGSYAVALPSRAAIRMRPMAAMAWPPR